MFNAAILLVLILIAILLLGIMVILFKQIGALEHYQAVVELEQHKILEKLEKGLTFESTLDRSVSSPFSVPSVTSTSAQPKARMVYTGHAETPSFSPHIGYTGPSPQPLESGYFPSFPQLSPALFGTTSIPQPMPQPQAPASLHGAQAVSHPLPMHQHVQSPLHTTSPHSSQAPQASPNSRPSDVQSPSYRPQEPLATHPTQTSSGLLSVTQPPSPPGHVDLFSLETSEKTLKTQRHSTQAQPEVQATSSSVQEQSSQTQSKAEQSVQASETYQQTADLYVVQPKVHSSHSHTVDLEMRTEDGKQKDTSSTDEMAAQTSSLGEYAAHEGPQSTESAEHVGPAQESISILAQIFPPDLDQLFRSTSSYPSAVQVFRPGKADESKPILTPQSAEAFALEQLDPAAWLEQSERSISHKMTVNDIDSAIVQAQSVLDEELDLHAGLQFILGVTFNQIEALDGAILLYRQDPGSPYQQAPPPLWFEATFGQHFETIHATATSSTKGILGYCVEEQAGLLIDDITIEPSFTEGIITQSGLSTGSFLCAPIQHNERLQGVFVLHNPPTHDPFTLGELHILTYLAHMTGRYVAEHTQK